MTGVQTCALPIFEVREHATSDCSQALISYKAYCFRSLASTRTNYYQKQIKHPVYHRFETIYSPLKIFGNKENSTNSFEYFEIEDWFVLFLGYKDHYSKNFPLFRFSTSYESFFVSQWRLMLSTAIAENGILRQKAFITLILDPRE